MQYQVKSFSDKDGFDVWMTISEEPSWYNPFSQGTYRRFYGSGSCWFEIVTNKWGEQEEQHCGAWMSSVLHGLWNEQLDKQIEAKTCKSQSKQ
jgi:hypothetical protein